MTTRARRKINDLRRDFIVQNFSAESGKMFSLHFDDSFFFGSVCCWCMMWFGSQSSLNIVTMTAESERQRRAESDETDWERLNVRSCILQQIGGKVKLNANGDWRNSSAGMSTLSSHHMVTKHMHMEMREQREHNFSGFSQFFPKIHTHHHHRRKQSSAQNVESTNVVSDEKGKITFFHLLKLASAPLLILTNSWWRSRVLFGTEDNWPKTSRQKREKSSLCTKIENPITYSQPCLSGNVTCWSGGEEISDMTRNRFEFYSIFH